MRSFPLAVLLLVSTASAASNPALVIRDDGYYFLSPTGTSLMKVGVVVDQRTGAGPTDPTDPTDPSDPLTERAQQIAGFSNIGTREEAATLAAVAQTLADQGVTGDVAWNAAFRIAITRAAGEVTPEWATWKTKADALAAGNFSSQFFADVAAGISSAHGIDLASVKQTASAGLSSFQGNDVDVQSINLGLRNREGRERITIGEIIELIKLILEILKDLGVFDSAVIQ